MTSRLQPHWYGRPERAGLFSGSCLHHDGDLTFTDRKAFEAHRKAEHTRLPCQGASVTASSGKLNVKMWKPPPFRAFDPQHGEVGSWVEWDEYGVWDHTVARYRNTTRQGQVWAIAYAGKRPQVIVADGTRYHTMSVSSLRPLVQAEQLALVS